MQTGIGDSSRRVSFGLLFFGFACLLSGGAAYAWASAAGPLTDAIHQKAIDNVLKSMSASDRKILKDQQSLVDKDQDPDQSAKHAMTGITQASQNEAAQRIIYIALSEDLIHKAMLLAINARKSNNINIALPALGEVIHALEDASSPSHRGFKIWSYQFGIWEMARHVLKERVYPNDGTADRYQSHLEGAVQYAYDIYMETVAIPVHCFDPINGRVILPPSYLHTY